MNFLLNVASLVETLVASFAMKRIIRKKNQDSIQLKTFGHNELNAASGAKPEEVSNFLTTKFLNVSSKTILANRELILLDEHSIYTSMKFPVLPLKIKIIIMFSLFLITI